MGLFKVKKSGVAAVARWLVAAVSILAIFSPAQAQDDTPVIHLQLNWFNQAQFAGFYVAEALGYYQREGIAVEFVPGGPQFPGAPVQDPLQVLELGGADVAVAWMSNAFAARAAGMDIVNIAQIFSKSGMSLICRRSAGINRPSDVKGKRIGLWNIGDQLDLAQWLQAHHLSIADVKTSEQSADAGDLISGKADCVSAMSYNEYWTLLRSFHPSDLYVVRYGDEGSAFLEDGLYVKADSLTDPVKRKRIVGFLRASSAGWSAARDNPEIAVAVTLYRTPGSDALHQRRMLESVLALADAERDFGLLDLDAFEKSVDILGAHQDLAAKEVLRRGWTHQIWREANETGGPVQLSPAVKHYLARVVNSPWFYVVGLMGVLASMVGAFMRAGQRRYDLWGAFILTLLAIGGGTLRDLLVGGDRLPLAMFRDPIYIIMVVTVVTLGSFMTRSLPQMALDSRRFALTLEFFDAIGVATFTVLGTEVAISAGLPWYWAPFCAALSCAGGGMLRDIVTGREPRTFQGEPYEEIAVVGSLALFGTLLFASRHEHASWIVVAAILSTMVSVFGLRMLVVVTGWRSFRLGHSADLPVIADGLPLPAVVAVSATAAAADKPVRARERQGA